MFYGSLTAQSDPILVFVCLLTHADPDGYVELPRPLIASMTGLPLPQVEAAIAVLEAPDPDSQSPELDGRRLETFGPGSWRVVNLRKYRSLRDEEERRTQNRTAKQKQRQHVSAKVSRSQPPSAHTEAEAYTEAEAKTEARLSGDSLTQRRSPRKAEKPSQPPKSLSITPECSSARAGPAFIELPTTRAAASCVVTEGDVTHWAGLYPAVDIRQELRNMLGWLEANPKNRKTPDGMRRFVAAWLSKEQNRSRATNGNGRGLSAGQLMAMADRMEETDAEA